MDILSYIIPNVLIALILVCGVINGQKRGFKKSLIKLSYTLVLAVGSFFLNACVIVPAIAAVEGIRAVALFPTLTWILVFGAFMSIAQLIFTIACNQADKEKRANRRQMKAVKKADITKKTREARHQDRIEAKRKHKEERIARKEAAKQWRLAHKRSRIFGSIIGFISAVLLSFMICIVIPDVGVAIGVLTENEKLYETVDSFYDHSVVGLIDNAITKEDEMNFAEKIVIDQFELAGLVETEE